MDQHYLQILASRIKIAPELILREYFEMAILQTFSETNLTKKMIFYGGTALRLAYGGPRFSEDLDFLMIKKITEKELEKNFHEICDKYSELSLVEVKMKRNTLFGLMKIRHPSLKHPRHIKIEICKKENKIQSEYKILHSDCSNYSPLIQTITIESLEKLKINAIKNRKEPRDWLDLWFISNILRKNFKAPVNFSFHKNEFIREMKIFLPMNKWQIIEEIIKKV